MQNNKKQNCKIWDMKLPQDIRDLNYIECSELCEEIRQILIDTVSKNGGHLASNLGTVELSVAIHRIFRTPKDKIIWDVGHQSYTHKILTGRLKKFNTLRQENGISGFPKPSESKHDAFISGHSSNSISAACGIARAMKMKGQNDRYAVVVIGDGAFTGGLAFEGLNNAGKSEDNLIIILNDNNMSISKNVGAFAKYLSKLRTKPGYLETKNAVEKVLDNTPFVGKPLIKAIKSSKSVIKGMIYHSTIFDDFGLTYLGPVDGHDIAELEKYMSFARLLKKPVLIHVNTVKGKGYKPAEKNPGAFHGVSRLNIDTGEPISSGSDSFSDIFGKELTRLAKYDKRICAVTAAMKYGTGLQFFSAKFPERCFDVGIAEQHAVTFSAGLAKSGMIPVFAVYSSFLQRAYDQILHDASIDNTHVILGIDRAGIVGEDGETHQGIFDVPMLTSIPGITLFSPSNKEELELCLYKAVFDLDGVVGIRYPRGEDKSEYSKDNVNTRYLLNINEKEILLITYGRQYNQLYKACGILNDKGINCDLLKLVQIFPIEEEIIQKIRSYKKIYFFEEGMKYGGIAEHMHTLLCEAGFLGEFKITALRGFIKQSSVESALDRNGLSSNEIVNKIISENKNV